MIFQGKHHAAGLGLGQTLLDGFEAPVEAFVLSVAGQHRLEAAGLHQVIETGERVPAPGIQPDARHAEFVRDLQALVRMFDLRLT